MTTRPGRLRLLDDNYTSPSLRPAGQIPTPPPHGVPTLEAFQARFLDYSEVNNKPSTVYAKRWALREHLVPAFGKRRLAEIGPADVEAYKARKLKDGQAARSVNNHLCVLRKLLNVAVEWGEISHAPRVKQLRVAHGDFQFLTFEETPRFLRAAAPEWKAFVTIALKTGLRVGELLALRWEDLHLVAGRLVVRRTLWRDQEGTPKGGRTREVPLSDEAIAVPEGAPAPQGTVRVLRGGRGAAHAQPREGRRALDVLEGRPREAAHDARPPAHVRVPPGHARVALKAVQELLGHATMDMTMRYAYLSPDVKRDAVRLLDGPAQSARFDSGALRAPTLTANGEEAPPAL